MFKKILIANRGNSSKNYKNSRELGIATVAVYSEADKFLHVTLADVAICIGSANSADSYLKIPNIISTDTYYKSEAIHRIWFLSNASFAKICAQNNIVFIGPSPELIKYDGRQRQQQEMHSNQTQSTITKDQMV